MDLFPLVFKEIVPDQTFNEKWKEIHLNTGGTQSTLQDIKLPQRAGGYWYKDSKKANTRNRFIYWRTTGNAIELSEASIDRCLEGAHVRYKVSSGTPPLDNVTIWEKPANREVIVLAATVSSVHRLIFPHPEVLQKKEKAGARGIEQSLSILHDANGSTVNHPNNSHILTHYANTSTPPPHTVASVLKPCGEAIFALAAGAGDVNGAGGVIVVRLPINGTPLLLHLKRESGVPRFLSGLTDAIRGKWSSEEVRACSVALDLCRDGSVQAFALCDDVCLRAWTLPAHSAVVTCQAVSQTLCAVAPTNVTRGAQGYKLTRAESSTGDIILVVYLCFAQKCEFTVIRPYKDEQGNQGFQHICHLYGPQLDLVDFGVSRVGDGNTLWALWSRADGEALTTATKLQGAVGWVAVTARPLPPTLPLLANHDAYLERLFAPGLFPRSVIEKALLVYQRAIVGNTSMSSSGSLRSKAEEAVIARVQRMDAQDDLNAIHKCWSDLYSWCVQYMEGLQKPLGLIVSQHDVDSEPWCAVVRRGDIALVRPLPVLERLLLARSPHEVTPAELQPLFPEASADLLRDIWSLVRAAGACERALGPAGRAHADARLDVGAAPNVVLQELIDDMMTPADDSDVQIITPEFIDQLSNMLEPIQDLHRAVMALNVALRLDAMPSDQSNGSDDKYSDEEYEYLFSSQFGVSLATEALYQMAEVRVSLVRGVLCAGRLVCGGDWPAAGHCAVHLQAYHAVRWLRRAHITHPPLNTVAAQLARLKLTMVSGDTDPTDSMDSAWGRCDARGVLWQFAAGAGGRRARAALDEAQAPRVWHQVLPLYAHHLGHLVWGVSGGFELGWWLASLGQPQLVQNYVALLKPWCEWNRCSRLFILGMSYLDAGNAEAAYTAFCGAANGVTKEPFLQEMIQSTTSLNSQYQALVLYYLKVIKLLELHDASKYVVRLAQTAISIADRDDPNLAMFHSLVFRAELQAGHVRRALSAAAANPAAPQRAAAATALLNSLAASGQLGILVKAEALSVEAAGAAEARAHLADAHADNPYYDFLYALHVHRQNYRKAAATMYERGARCAAEGGGSVQAIRWHQRCLLAALTCLRLAPPAHAFLVRPGQPRGDKRTSDGERQGAPPLEVLGVECLEKELVRVSAALTLAERMPEMACADTGVNKLVSGLCASGLPCAALKLNPDAALEAFVSELVTMAHRCQDDASYETKVWQFLNDNGVAEVSGCTVEKSAIDSGWKLLQLQIEQFSGEHSSLLHTVCQRLLSMGEFLPHWLLAKYKMANISECTRTLLHSGYLIDAAQACKEILDTMLGSCRNVVGLQGPFIPTSRTLWCPLNMIDQVVAELECHLDDEECKQTYEELNKLIESYVEVVTRTSEDMKSAKIQFPIRA